MSFLQLVRHDDCTTCPSSLFSIYIIQSAVYPQSKHKTPIHPRWTWTDQVWHENDNRDDVEENTHEAKEGNQVWGQPHWHQRCNVVPVRCQYESCYGRLVDSGIAIESGFSWIKGGRHT